MTNYLKTIPAAVVLTLLMSTATAALTTVGEPYELEDAPKDAPYWQDYVADKDGDGPWELTRAFLFGSELSEKYTMKIVLDTIEAMQPKGVRFGKVDDNGYQTFLKGVTYRMPLAYDENGIIVEPVVLTESDVKAFDEEQEAAFTKDLKLIRGDIADLRNSQNVMANVQAAIISNLDGLANDVSALRDSALTTSQVKQLSEDTLATVMADESSSLAKALADLNNDELAAQVATITQTAVTKEQLTTALKDVTVTDEQLAKAFEVALATVMADESSPLTSRLSALEKGAGTLANRVTAVEKTAVTTASVEGLVEDKLREIMGDKSSPFRVMMQDLYGGQVMSALNDPDSQLSQVLLANADQVKAALADPTHELSVALAGNADQVKAALADPASLLSLKLIEKADAQVVFDLKSDVTATNQTLSGVQSEVTKTSSWLMWLVVAVTAVVALFATGFVRLRGRTAQVERIVEKEIYIPVELESRLDQVTNGGSAYQPTIMVDGVKHLIEITASPEATAGEAQFFIKGIEGQRNAVKKSNMRTRIRRAAGKGHFVPIQTQAPTARKADGLPGGMVTA